MCLDLCLRHQRLYKPGKSRGDDMGHDDPSYSSYMLVPSARTASRAAAASPYMYCTPKQRCMCGTSFQRFQHCKRPHPTQTTGVTDKPRLCPLSPPHQRRGNRRTAIGRVWAGGTNVEDEVLEPWRLGGWGSLLLLIRHILKACRIVPG